MRVMATGLGMVTAVGNDTESTWAALVKGEPGIGPVRRLELGDLPVNIAGEVDIDHKEDWGRDPESDRGIMLALRAAREAVDHAELTAAYEPARVGLVVATSQGATRGGENYHRRLLERGARAADARQLLAYPLNSVGDAVARHTGFQGPRATVSNACAAGGVAIGYALELLWAGDADAVLCGGVDPLSMLSFAGFNCLGALDPEGCAPYTRSQGLSLGEGAGFVVLEREETARSRGAVPIAEFAGYGLSADGHHQTAPDPGGAGAARSMRVALASAGHTAQDVDYVNGHGTGTPTNDLVEPKAIKSVFAEPPPVSSSKSMLGHTLGAAGVIEAICSVLAISRGSLPPTANAAAGSRSGLDIVPDLPRAVPADVVLSNSFGFGGNNATVVVRRAGTGRPAPPAAVRARTPERVVVTGIAALAGTAGDHASLMGALESGEPLFTSGVDIDGFGRYPVAAVDLEAAGAGIKPGVLRRMDPLGRLAAAAVRELHLRHGRPDRRQAERTGVLFATGSGPISTVEHFHRGVIQGGAAGADARLFPNTVVNAAAGHVAVLHRFRGPTATMCSGSTSTVSALHYAHRLIRRGEVDRIIVLSADECPPELVAGYAKVPGFLSRDDVSPFGTRGVGGTVMGAAAGAVLLQSERAALDEGTPILGELTGFGLTGDGSGIGRLDGSGTAWAASFEGALAGAGLGADQVDLVVASAAGRGDYDGPEQRALVASGLADRPIFAPKSFIGEVGASASTVGLAVALHAFSTGRVPGNRNVVNAAPELTGLLGANGGEGPVRNALLSSATPGGTYQSVVISQWQK